MTNEVLVRPCQFGNPAVWAAKNAKEHAALLPPYPAHHSLQTFKQQTFAPFSSRQKEL
jgi:hypothetical protein